MKRDHPKPKTFQNPHRTLVVKAINKGNKLKDKVDRIKEEQKSFKE